MSDCNRDSGIDIQLLEDAQTLVLGVVTARHNKSQNDVNILIDSYMEEARSRGIRSPMSWAMLFSASVLWVDTLIECRAEHHGTTHQEAVSELSLILAGGDIR